MDYNTPKVNIIYGTTYEIANLKLNDILRNEISEDLEYVRNKHYIQLINGDTFRILTPQNSFRELSVCGCDRLYVDKKCSIDILLEFIMPCLMPCLSNIKLDYMYGDGIEFY